MKFCNIGFNFKICFENYLINAFWAGLDIGIPFLHELHLKTTFNFSAKPIYIFYTITYPYIVQSNIKFFEYMKSIYMNICYYYANTAIIYIFYEKIFNVLPVKNFAQNFIILVFI